MAIYETEYLLAEPIKYSHNGDMEETDRLVLYAPNYKQREYAFYLEEVIAKASMEGMKLFADFAKPDDKKKDESVKPDGKAMIKAIMFSSYDFNEVMKKFDKLLLNDACKLDGKEPLKQVILEKISIDDQKNILAVYLENFIMPSLFE